MQSSSDVITVVDADENILYQSPSLNTVLGYDPEDNIGATAVDVEIVHPTTRSRSSPR